MYQLRQKIISNANNARITRFYFTNFEHLIAPTKFSFFSRLKTQKLRNICFSFILSIAVLGVDSKY